LFYCQAALYTTGKDNHQVEQEKFLKEERDKDKDLKVAPIKKAGRQPISGPPTGTGCCR